MGGSATLIGACLHTPQPGPLISLSVNFGSKLSSDSFVPAEETATVICFGSKSWTRIVWPSSE